LRTDAPELTRDELEAQLARLHEASFGWALSCCGWNDADAEDVLQTTYLKVVSGRARFGGRSAFRTWLFGVIRQTAREHGRRARSHRERAELLAREPAPASGPSPHELVERAERARALRAALEELPERQRDVLHLVFYQDLTIREAAEVLEVSLGTARVHYERGKQKLRALLDQQEASGGAT
jgi:RNA polymerase sigma-70 factor (ECF subfamily)